MKNIHVFEGSWKTGYDQETFRRNARHRETREERIIREEKFQKEADRILSLPWRQFYGEAQLNANVGKADLMVSNLKKMVDETINVSSPEMAIQRKEWASNAFRTLATTLVKKGERYKTSAEQCIKYSLSYTPISLRA